MVRGARELSGVSFIRALTPFKRAPPLQANHLPEALLGSEDLVYDFRGEANIQTIAYTVHFSHVFISSLKEISGFSVQESCLILFST